MDRADKALVDPIEGLLQALGFLAPGFGQALLQPQQEAAPHFAGGLAREGDGRHAVDLRADEAGVVDHALHQRVGLAGTGAGQDDHIAV